MKAGIHPEIKETKVHCNGCGIDFVTQGTVDTITIEICSNCHPFYTGKQKLVDTAGRVEKFKARTAAASKRREEADNRAKDRAQKEAAKAQSEDPDLKEIAEELETKTVDQPASEA